MNSVTKAKVVRKTAAKKSRVFFRILGLLKPNAGWVILNILFCTVSVAGTLLCPVLIGRAVNQIKPGQTDWQQLGMLLTALAVTVAVTALFSYLFARISGSLAFRTGQRLKKDCARHILESRLSTLDSVSHGDILSRIGVDADTVADGVAQGLTQFYSALATIFGTIGFMLAIDWRTAVIVVCLTPVSLLTALLLARLGVSSNKRHAGLRGEIGGLVAESFGNQRLIKLFRYEDDLEQRFDTLNTSLAAASVRAQFSTAAVNPAARFCNGLVYTAVAVWGAYSITSGIGKMDVGTLSTFLLYAGQYTRPFNDLSAVAAELVAAGMSARRIFEFLDTPKELETGDRILDDVRGHIELCHVRFGYNPERPIFRDLNLDIAPGTRVALVGPTGCGKTTLINLLMRFCETDGGVIKIDGQDIRTLSLHSLRTSFSLALQQAWTPHVSVSDIIAYGMPQATKEQVMDAARRAHAHRFIELLPDGYDTVITDDSTFSEGQRQLLMIARLLLLEAPMLILDEATSRLDTRTELHIQNAFSALSRGRTSLVIAHRLSTIIDADIILVMRDGEIIEQGTHPDLLQKNGFYTELYRAQFETEDRE